MTKESTPQSAGIHEKLTEAFEHYAAVSKKLKAAENVDKKNKLKIRQLEVITSFWDSLINSCCFDYLSSVWILHKTRPTKNVFLTMDWIYFVTHTRIFMDLNHYCNLFTDADWYFQQGERSAFLVQHVGRFQGMTHGLVTYSILGSLQGWENDMVGSLGSFDWIYHITQCPLLMPHTNTPLG